ncbi:MAG TPA: translocation/assembly module TamB domain-containing protein, partial [Kofleriaceae bacterium]|nr:translocation/assembly module TamB domain-containing protein [Kofleriaceae bacterium]
AQLAAPARLADPEAWRALGTRAIRAASLRAKDLRIDPGTLARAGLASTLRGTATLDLEVADAMRAIHVTADLAELRGTPIAKPVDLHLDATLDGSAADATLAMTADRRKVTMLEVHARVPVGLDRLRTGDPRALPIAGTVKLAATSAPRLLAVFGRREVVGGTLAGDATVGGTIGKPTVTAHVTATDLAPPQGLHGKPVQAIAHATLDASWDGRTGKLALDASEAGGALHVAARGSPYDLAHGTAQITATRFDTSPLLAFAPGPAGAARGQLDASLAVRGFDLRTSQITGELHLRDARVPIAPTVGTLHDASLDAQIRAHDILIDGRGKLGAGTATLDGSIALDGASLTGGKAKLVLRKVSPIGAVQPTIDADVSATLARKGTQWTADLVVDRGKIVIPNSSGEKLKPIGAPADLIVDGERPTGHTSPSAPPPEPVIVAHVTLHPTQVQSEEVRTVIAGKLAITADARSVGVTGTISAERGDLDLFGRRYTVDRASAYFDGTTDPVLDIRIFYNFTDVTTITEVRGRLSKPELVLSSNPGTYTQAQLVGFLLGGEPGGDPSSAGLGQQATSLGTSLVANQLTRYVRKALPIDIDVIRYEAATTSNSAAITVGTWITHQVFFSYREHLEARPDENTGEGTLEYWFTRRLELQATAGDRNYDSVDLLWHHRY